MGFRNNNIYFPVCLNLQGWSLWTFILAHTTKENSCMITRFESESDTQPIYRAL